MNLTGSMVVTGTVNTGTGSTAGGLIVHMKSSDPASSSKIKIYDDSTSTTYIRYTGTITVNTPTGTTALQFKNGVLAY